MENIIIRNIKKEDIASIVDIQISGWKNAYKGIIDEKILDSMNKEERIKKRKEDYKIGGFLIAELNKEIVGFCRYINSNKYSKEVTNIDCEILALYIKIDLKRNGIGTKLFKIVVNELKKQHKNRMLVWCLKDNKAAINFYTKMGGIIQKERIIEIEDKSYDAVGFIYNI